MPTKIQIIEEGICPDTFDDKDLPTDVHIITFTKDGERQFDAVRAYSKTDIFDEYYDKLGKDNPIHSIESGYGRIKPKLYGKIKPKTKSDHIAELLARIEAKVNKLTIKQLKALHIKHFQKINAHRKLCG